jgi:hypothetical protein
MISQAWYTSTPGPTALQASRVGGMNSATLERRAALNVRHWNSAPSAKSTAPAAIFTFFALEYQEGQRDARTNQAHTRSGAAGISISFRT